MLCKVSVEERFEDDGKAYCNVNREQFRKTFLKFVDQPVYIEESIKSKFESDGRHSRVTYWSEAIDGWNSGTSNLTFPYFDNLSMGNSLGTMLDPAPATLQEHATPTLSWQYKNKRDMEAYYNNTYVALDLNFVMDFDK